MIMSKVKNNSALGGISALLGDTVVARKVRGQYVFSTPRRRPRKPTPRQVVVREKFREASRYARHQNSIPESKALYETGITRRKRTSYLVALSDYLNAPEVKHIDPAGYRGAVGNIIRLKATDDFMVTRVFIEITDASGALIEEGDAVREARTLDRWTYKATVSNPLWIGTTIRVWAYDGPGNTGTAEVVVQPSPLRKWILRFTGFPLFGMKTRDRSKIKHAVPAELN
jgi:hypothetical protein